MAIPDELAAILACPKCRGPLGRPAEPEGFACAACGLFFAVEDGIPDFRIGEAIPWSGEGRRRPGEARRDAR